MGFIRWNIKIISIRGKISGIKFGAGYLYARKDIDFLQNFISEKLAEISKAKASKMPGLNLTLKISKFFPKSVAVKGYDKKRQSRENLWQVAAKRRSDREQ